MKTNETQTSSLSDELNVVSKNVFGITDEGLKSFFLKEAVLLVPSYCTPNRNEFQILSILLKEYKKILEFFTQLNSFPWKLGIPDMHDVCIPYLLQDSLSAKERKRVGGEISRHIHFLTLLVSKSRKNCINIIFNAKITCRAFSGNIRMKKKGFEKTFLPGQGLASLRCACFFRPLSTDGNKIRPKHFFPSSCFISIVIK